jgi:hypothetical protein
MLSRLVGRWRIVARLLVFGERTARPKRIAEAVSEVGGAVDSLFTPIVLNSLGRIRQEIDCPKMSRSIDFD